MDKKTVNLEIINGLKSKGINIAEVERYHLEAFSDIMYKAINKDLILVNDKIEFIKSLPISDMMKHD